MTQATATRITYRRTKTGEWVAFGPAGAITAGVGVTVSKRSGETETRTVLRTGRTFQVDGQTMVYGYLADRDAIATVTVDSGTYLRTADIPHRSRRPAREMCAECGERRGYIEARDMSGIGGLVCGRCIRDEGTLSFA